MKLKQLTERMCELLEGTELYPIATVKMQSDLSNQDKERVELKPIGLEEIIFAYKRQCKLTYITSKPLEQMFIANLLSKNILGLLKLWNYGKPLIQQSQETIDFLHEILVL